MQKKIRFLVNIVRDDDTGNQVVTQYGPFAEPHAVAICENLKQTLDPLRFYPEVTSNDHD